MLEPTVVVARAITVLVPDAIGFTLVVSIIVLRMLVARAGSMLVERMSALFVLIVSSTVLLIITLEIAVLESDFSVMELSVVVWLIKVTMVLSATFSVLGEITVIVNISPVSLIPEVVGVETVLDFTAFVVIDDSIVEM